MLRPGGQGGTEPPAVLELGHDTADGRVYAVLFCQQMNARHNVSGMLKMGEGFAGEPGWGQKGAATGPKTGHLH